MSLCRPMQVSDLPTVLAVQRQCYRPGFLEPREAFASKLRASPDSCWIASQDGVLLGYLVTLPIQHDQIPALHAEQWQAPAQPDWLYVHDLAVAPAGRGTGTAHTLLANAYAFAHKHAISEIGLIAVQDSVPYWIKRGFSPCWPSARVSSAKLASFGPEARYMNRTTSTS